MGNSIYTIFMPREAFSRKANAELVARSLNQLDIPASVNERHDIVVDDHKVSGSAYKITNARAYHHGTMLIDADTETLKNCLSKKRMMTVCIYFAMIKIIAYALLLFRKELYLKGLRPYLHQ